MFAFGLNVLALIAVVLYCFKFSPSLSTLWLRRVYATEHISIQILSESDGSEKYFSVLIDPEMPSSQLL